MANGQTGAQQLYTTTTNAADFGLSQYLYPQPRYDVPSVYHIPAQDCTVDRDPISLLVKWTAPIPPGVTRVVTPQGKQITVSPGTSTLYWVETDHYTQFSQLRSDVKTHAKVNGGKLMFNVIARETLDGHVYVVQFDGRDVFTSTDNFDSRGEAEKAGAKFVGKAVQKLLTA